MNLSTPTSLTFLGTADAVPEAGRDVASFVVNGTHLVDMGWYSTAQMFRYGIDPLKIKTIILTHCHQDHYLGLPQFFFYWSQRWRPEMGAPSLTMIGPEDMLKVRGDLSSQGHRAQGGGGLRRVREPAHTA